MINVIYSFHFLRPWWLLLIIPLLFLFWKIKQYHFNNNQWNEICDHHLIPHLVINAHSKNLKWPFYLLAFIWFFICISIAGPTWKRLPEIVYSSKAARMIILDLSKQMYATDIPPSRIVRARFKILDLLKRPFDGQTAMIVYAGSPHIISPLTQDADTIASMVDVLDPNLMPKSGSNLYGALDLAQSLFHSAGVSKGEIILFTAGPIQERVFTKAKSLHQDNFNLSIMGMGDTNGSPIPLPNGGFLQNSAGDIIISKLALSDLKKLASVGGGIYSTFTASNDDLKKFENLSSYQTDKSSEQKMQRWKDEGRLIIICLLPLAALAFRRGWFS